MEVPQSRMSLARRVGRRRVAVLRHVRHTVQLRLLAHWLYSIADHRRGAGLAVAPHMRMNYDVLARITDHCFLRDANRHPAHARGHDTRANPTAARLIIGFSTALVVRLYTRYTAKQQKIGPCRYEQ